MRRESPSQQHTKNKVKKIWRKKAYCSHCDRGGHQRATCWRLHPEQHHKDKASVHEPGETIVRPTNVEKGDDPVTLISERLFI